MKQIQSIGSRELIMRVRGFAIWAHGDQIYGDSSIVARPYVYHLDSVAALVECFAAPDRRVDLTCAAYLHDVVEDTHVTAEVIEGLFGSEVAGLVTAVTNEPGVNRRARHINTYPKIREAGADAVLLKVCDRIANVRAAYPEVPRLLKMYAEEQRSFNDALRIDGEHDEAWRLLRATFLAAGVERFP